MIQTIMKIGEKLRETGNVEYLPFVTTSDRSDKKRGNKTIKTKLIVYDVYTNEDGFRIKKSDNQIVPQTVKSLFIKGDNNDRFYIAGDISSNFFGKDKHLIKYFKYKGINEKIDELTPFVSNFRKALNSKIKELENELKSNVNKEQIAIIHFRFIDKTSSPSYWALMRNELEKIGEFIIRNFYTKFNEGVTRYVIKKAIFSAINEYNYNSLQFLNPNNIYKVFDIQDATDKKIKDIIVGASQLPKTNLVIGKVLIQILPAGNYNSESLIKFLGKKTLNRKGSDLNEEEKGLTFQELLKNQIQRTAKINKFDILFLKKGGQTVDVIGYISQIQLGEILKVTSRIEKAKKLTLDFVTKSGFLPFFGDRKTYLDLFKSLSKLLGDQTKEDKKLEKHQISLLYKVFRSQYYSDPLLLTGLIRHTEYSLRNSENHGFIYLFIDYYFINQILLFNEYNIMKETQSYMLGQKLGELARNLNSKINSFSKQYAGNISRRVTSISDFQRLLNSISEKLTIHGLLYPKTRETVSSLNKLIVEFTGPYKKDYVVAGFFSTYLMPFTKKVDQE